MNRLLFNKMATWAGTVVLGAVVGLAPYAQAQDAASQNSQNQDAQNAQASASATVNGQRSDGQIEMDVVHALDASQALKSDLITAATIQNEVTLSGTVSSDASKQLAGSIAGQVAGVTKVHNNLEVGNPQDAQNVAPPPQDAQDATGAVQGAPQPNNQPYGAQGQQPDNQQPYGAHRRLHHPSNVRIKGSIRRRDRIPRLRRRGPSMELRTRLSSPSIRSNILLSRGNILPNRDRILRSRGNILRSSSLRLINMRGAL